MKKVLILLVAVFLAGCATSYQKEGFTGGYSEVQLDENVFKVSFRGNGYTRKNRAADLALLRSAELTLQNGFNYFVIVNSDNSTRNSTYTTPTTSYTNASAYGNSSYAYGTATTTTYGGQTYNISKPSTSNTIICFKAKPEGVFSYNAKFLYKSMSEKYGVNKQK